MLGSARLGRLVLEVGCPAGGTCPPKGPEMAPKWADFEQSGAENGVRGALSGAGAQSGAPGGLVGDIVRAFPPRAIAGGARNVLFGFFGKF